MSDRSFIGVPRARLDVCCNDPDNGLFAHTAEQLQVTTWDGADLQLECVRDAIRETADEARDG